MTETAEAQQEAGARSEPASCELTLLPVEDGVRCGRPALERVRTCCVHEHLEWTWLCAGCLRMLRRGMLVCTPCCIAGEQAHSCPVEEVPPETEASKEEKRNGIRIPERD